MTRGRIPEEILDTIRERTAIEKVIGEYVPLKRAGRHFKGLCPFHQEKTPSFTVNTDLQIFKCFGCGESGNVFIFLMKYENITFVEAVEKLATAAGITLPEESSESPRRKDETALLLETIQAAWRLYSAFLLNDPQAEPARQYLARRGIDRKLIQTYGLGYSPDQWDFLTTSLKKNRNTLLNAGLLVQSSESSRVYDRFRNRVIFPIRDFKSGNVVAFGGRTLGDDPAKYINSPDSPIYHKSRILYGLFEAQKEIRSRRSAILVEGYFDRIALDRSGFSNAVAPCGTAITPEQIRLLKRYADTVFLLFDSDPAGLKAARKALELCLTAGLESKAVPLPEGLDPDDLLRKDGPDALKTYIDRSVPGLDFLIRHAGRRFDLSQAKGRREAVEDVIPFLVEVENSIDRGSYISRIADLLSVPAESVMELCRRYKVRRNKKETSEISSESASQETEIVKPDELEQKERDLFCFFLMNPEYLLWEHNPLTIESMQSHTGREIYALIRGCMSGMGELSVSRMIETTEDDHVRRTLIDLFDDPDRERRIVDRDPATVFQSLVRCFRERDLRNELVFIREQLSRQGISEHDIEFLLKRKVEILDELNTQSSLDA